MVLRRGWHNLITDKWTVEVKEEGVFDPRLYTMMAAYRTRVDSVLSPNSSPNLKQKDHQKIFDDLYTR